MVHTASGHLPAGIIDANDQQTHTSHDDDRYGQDDLDLAEEGFTSPAVARYPPQRSEDLVGRRPLPKVHYRNLDLHEAHLDSIHACSLSLVDTW